MGHYFKFGHYYINSKYVVSYSIEPVNSIEKWIRLETVRGSHTEYFKNEDEANIRLHALKGELSE